MTRISKFSYHLINNLSNKSETIVSKSSLLNMKNMPKNNRILYASNFIYNELPIRFAKRIRELEHLPLYLEKDHEIFTIRDWYLQSLDDITILDKPKNLDDCNKVKDVLKNISDRHSGTLTTMANGINKLKSINLIDNDFDNFLNNFYINRTRTRFLIGNYLDYFIENDNIIGAIDLNCNINDIIQSSLYDIKSIADIHRIDLPEITVDIPKYTLTYPTIYLNYILVEIIKNSIVATKDINNPEINITSIIDNNFIIIKISDNGIGIPYNKLDDIWRFSYTTTNINYDDLYKTDIDKKNPLSGLGYGLPISRIFLQTFNGNIKIFSNQNIGTDTYLFIDIKSNWLL